MTDRIFPRIQRGFLYFLLYSFIGWVYEIFLEVVVYRWGYSDRGVLFGPYCPVYGVGALVFLLCFGRLMARPGSPAFRAVRVLLVFLGCMLTATALELATSYFLEALTGSWPWQTYVNYGIHFQEMCIRDSNLGHLKLLCNETQQLGTQQNQCQVHKIMIGHMDSPLQSYGFKYCFFLLAGLYFKTFRVICNSQFAQKPVSILLSFHTSEKDTAG